jgi:NifU-like protein involved in Fe-S cluster formation
MKTQSELRQLVPQVFDLAAAHVENKRLKGQFTGCCSAIASASSSIENLNSVEIDRLVELAQSTLACMFKPNGDPIYWWPCNYYYEDREKFDETQQARIDSLLMAAAVTDFVVREAA